MKKDSEQKPAGLDGKPNAVGDEVEVFEACMDLMSDRLRFALADLDFHVRQLGQWSSGPWEAKDYEYIRRTLARLTAIVQFADDVRAAIDATPEDSKQ